MLKCNELGWPLPPHLELFSFRTEVPGYFPLLAHLHHLLFNNNFQYFLNISW